MNIVSLMTTLKNQEGSNNKRDFITDNHTEEMLYLFEVAFSPYIVTGISKLLYNPDLCKPVYQDKFDAFKNLVEYLINKNINGADRMLVTKFMEDCSRVEAALYADVLTKKFRLGINAKSVNKALGYKLIPLFDVMLAEPKKENKIVFPCLVETKYDGVRIIIRKENGKITAFTRKGKAIIFPKLFAELKKAAIDNFVLDGEIVNGTDRLKTTSVVNKLLKGNDGVGLDKDLDFYVFDGLSIKDWDSQLCTVVQSKRTLLVTLLITNSDMKSYKVTENIIANNEKELNTFYQKIRNAGGEGVIVKKLQGLYEFKRSTNWLKAKAINTCTMRITGIYEGDLKNTGKLGGFNISSEDGKIQHNVGSGFSDIDREELWTIGETGLTNKFVEIQYNELQYSSKDGSPYLFLPIFKEIRVDKTEADTLEKISSEES